MSDREDTAQSTARWMLGWASDPVETLKHWQSGLMHVPPDRALELAYAVIAEQREQITKQREQIATVRAENEELTLFRFKAKGRMGHIRSLCDMDDGT